MSPQYGLVALQPCDYRYDWDMATKEGASTWRLAVERQRPLCILAGINCTEWCFYNSHVNY